MELQKEIGSEELGSLLELYRGKLTNLRIVVEDVDQMKGLTSDQKALLKDLLELTSASNVPQTRLNELVRQRPRVIEETSTVLELVIEKSNTQRPIQINPLNIWLSSTQSKVEKSGENEAQNELKQISEKLIKLCSQQASMLQEHDDFGLYIPPSGSWGQYSTQSFDLLGAVNEFIESNKSVLLVLGESGGGKSFFGTSLIKQHSDAYHFGDRIPIFISLASSKRPIDYLIIDIFTAYGFSIREIEILKKTQKLLVYLDGYDELNITKNLYLSNDLKAWNAKVIFSCRKSYLATIDYYSKCFMPYIGQQPLKDLYQEVYIAPFVTEQINLYIEQYLSVKNDELQRSRCSPEWLNAELYIRCIDELLGLKALVKTPFLLRITMEILPEIENEHRIIDNKSNTEITKLKLYDVFIKQWFSRQEDKYVSSGLSVSKTFHKDCYAFAKLLAKAMREKGITQVYYEEESSLFEDSVSNEPNQWALFFSEKQLPQDRGSEERRVARIQTRKANPIREVARNTWAFLHTSLLEYFVSKLITDPVASTGENQRQLNTSPLNEYIIQKTVRREVAEELFREEGIRIDFEIHEVEKNFSLDERASADVFLGRRKDTSKRFVAIKKITSNETIKYLKDAIKVQLQLNGLPNIMPIFDVSELIENQSPVLYCVMPLAGFGNGLHFAKCFFTHAENTQREKLLAHIAKSILTGLKFMHGRRVYHLDIKPSNFVLDCRGYVYITDFSSAVRKYDNSRDALLKECTGDLRYFSPKRMDHMRYCMKRAPSPTTYCGVEADIWALGVSLLEIARGSFPFPPIFPPEEEINRCLELWNTDYCMRLLESQFRELYQESKNTFIELIMVLLALNSEHNITAEKALNLPMLQKEEILFLPNELESLIRMFIEQVDQQKNVQSKKGLAEKNCSSPPLGENLARFKFEINGTSRYAQSYFEDKMKSLESSQFSNGK